jgi:hypothetical protein
MTYVPEALRRQISDRAGGRCEYYRYPQDASFVSFEMEHIVAEKHGGPTDLENLALACPYCNRFKGADLGSFDPESGILTQFFNPRLQRWADHFRLEGAEIVPLTPEGRVTVLILQLNHPDRLRERRLLIEAGQYGA